MLLSPPGALRRKKYSVVLLDAGQTLFEPDPPVGVRYAQVAAKYGLHVSPGDMEKAFRQGYRDRSQRQALSTLTSNEAERRWWRELAWDLFRRFGPLTAFDDCFEELYAVFAHAEAWRVFPEVPEFLAQSARRGVRLALVSNWDSRLETLCRELALTPAFEFILYSAGAGVAKPNPGIFQQALRRLGAGPGEALHVGDSWDEDVLGARAAGLDAVWLQRPEAQSVPGAATAGKLTDIVDLLQGK
jgi:putative hydrolase of the HAD superfamily